MTEKKSDILKNILINLGVLLILVGSTAMKEDMAFFLIGLVLLSIQTFGITVAQPKKLAIAENPCGDALHWCRNPTGQR